MPKLLNIVVPHENNLENLQNYKDLLGNPTITQEIYIEIPQNNVENSKNSKNGLINQNQASTSSKPKAILFSMDKSTLLERYQKYKNEYPKMTEAEIAKKLKISYSTLYILKKSEGMIKSSNFFFII